MSSVGLTIARLKLQDDVTALCPAERIYPVEAPQKAAFPHIVVTLIYEDDDQMIGGAAEFYLGRVQVICIAQLQDGVASAAAVADNLAEAAKGALKDNVAGLTIDGKEGVDFWKAGADAMLPTKDRQGVMRTTDFYVRWRA